VNVNAKQNIERTAKDKANCCIRPTICYILDVMRLPQIEESNITNRRVIVRADLDVEVTQNSNVKGQNEILRLQMLLPTINLLLGKNNSVVIIGHKGRPEGKFVAEESLVAVCDKLSDLLGKKIEFFNNFVDEGIRVKIHDSDFRIAMLENLRFDVREEENDEEFVRILASLGEFYVNEAFANSHRNHASIVGIPKFLPHAAGLHFTQEVENLSEVFENPKRPVIVIISGVKEDKLDCIEGLSKFADKILIGGRLPEYLEGDSRFKIYDSGIIKADLNQDKEDITIHSIEKFEEEIKKAGTIVVSGPLGKFEDEGHKLGTERIFKAVADSSAFKVAGGGDTEKAIQSLGLSTRFDWISVGGGAMLEFLAKGTLPGIEALLN
jgi:phosphoglycerate kinase